jgi:uncharacterized protein
MGKPQPQQVQGERALQISLVLTLFLALSTLVTGAASAQSRDKGTTPSRGTPYSHSAERQKANENLLMVLGGYSGGSYSQLAQDIALTVDDGDNLRVMPVAGEGAVRNVRDVLFLTGIDLGITSVQVLNALKASGEYGPDLERRIAYIAPLSVDLFHVLARPEYGSLKDLAGKKVSFFLKGSATATFGPKVLKALGVDATEVHVSPNDGLQLMERGELDAVACICPVPVSAFPMVRPESGFRFLEVPYIPPFEQDFLPGSLTSAHYPNSIAAGTSVQTIATNTVLVAFNWAPGTERYRKIERFVNVFFSRFDKLREAPRHPAWRSVNVAATIPGWQRFPAAQQWLDRQAAATAAKKAPPSAAGVEGRGAQAGAAAPDDTAEQERLFREFIEWSRTRGKR